MYWRATELPKLKKLPEFAQMRFTHVIKPIRATVPAADAFPPQIRHLQPVLAQAANGVTGSPQLAILADGKLVDYWIGISTSRSDASDIAATVRALMAGEPAPRATCKKLASSTACLTPG
ncbi:hypothetical protein [Ramlibacter albus]|uniref:Uncharacterized protein n=1 Tax=Ramlibacter albus TaxID=2079448 RepID=A0A923M9A2_9BURK|nr:hypothetical protein [Ramlibacter albus]MBC5765119.1 hypothetical protein [Ramlibacter albus]